MGVVARASYATDNSSNFEHCYVAPTRRKQVRRSRELSSVRDIVKGPSDVWVVDPISPTNEAIVPCMRVDPRFMVQDPARRSQVNRPGTCHAWRGSLLGLSQKVDSKRVMARVDIIDQLRDRAPPASIQRAAVCSIPSTIDVEAPCVGPVGGTIMRMKLDLRGRDRG